MFASRTGSSFRRNKNDWLADLFLVPVGKDESYANNYCTYMLNVSNWKLAELSSIKKKQEYFELPIYNWHN